jgi:dimethylamine monooxygenase subunit A
MTSTHEPAHHDNYQRADQDRLARAITGPPRFDVGLRPIDISQWLQPDDQSRWLDAKNALIDRQPDSVFVAQERSLAAQAETADLIAAHCGMPFNTSEAPLLAVSRLVSDDLVIMESCDDAWTNTACCLCSPTFFSAEYALGKSLEILHEPVPDGDFGLAKRIGRVFTHLAPDRVLERHNWTVQWSDARYTPDASAMRAAAAQADESQAPSSLFIRTERQTIRRLPNTGAVLFTIRIGISPLIDHVEQEPSRHLFRDAWQSATDPVRGYKKWAVLERHVAALLARYDD